MQHIELVKDISKVSEIFLEHNILVKNEFMYILNLLYCYIIKQNFKSVNIKTLLLYLNQPRIIPVLKDRNVLLQLNPKTLKVFHSSQLPIIYCANDILSKCQNQIEILQPLVVKITEFIVQNVELDTQQDNSSCSINILNLIERKSIQLNTIDLQTLMKKSCSILLALNLCRQNVHSSLLVRLLCVFNQITYTNTDNLLQTFNNNIQYIFIYLLTTQQLQILNKNLVISKELVWNQLNNIKLNHILGASSYFPNINLSNLLVSQFTDQFTQTQIIFDVYGYSDIYGMMKRICLTFLSQHPKLSAINLCEKILQYIVCIIDDIRLERYIYIPTFQKNKIKPDYMKDDLYKAIQEYDMVNPYNLLNIIYKLMLTLTNEYIGILSLQSIHTSEDFLKLIGLCHNTLHIFNYKIIYSLIHNNQLDNGIINMFQETKDLILKSQDIIVNSKRYNNSIPTFQLIQQLFNSENRDLLDINTIFNLLFLELYQKSLSTEQKDIVSIRRLSIDYTRVLEIKSFFANCLLSHPDLLHINQEKLTKYTKKYEQSLDQQTYEIKSKNKRYSLR